MLELMMSGGKVPPPAGKIVEMGMIGNGIAALTSSGNLYVITDSYTSGTGAQVTKWTLLGTDVKEFRCAYRTVVWRTNAERWRMVGVNNYFGSLPAQFVTATDITSQIDISAVGLKDWQISNNTFALLHNGGTLLKLRGTNQYGACGSGNTLSQKNGWVNVGSPTVGVQILQVQLPFDTSDTTWILLSDGRVGGWGFGAGGQLGGSTNATTALTFITSLTNTSNKKIVGGNQGLFTLRDDPANPGTHQIWSNGFQSSGSLGRGAGSNANYPTPQLVATSNLSVEQSTFKMGSFMAKFLNANGKWWHTGNNPASNAVWNNGDVEFPWNTGAAIGTFTEMPAATMNPTNTWYMSRANINQSYYLDNGNLFGAGSATNGLLPGFESGVIRDWVQLDTSTLV